MGNIDMSRPMRRTEREFYGPVSITYKMWTSRLVLIAQWSYVEPNSDFARDVLRTPSPKRENSLQPGFGGTFLHDYVKCRENSDGTLRGKKLADVERCRILEVIALDLFGAHSTGLFRIDGRAVALDYRNMKKRRAALDPSSHS